MARACISIRLYIACDGMIVAGRGLVEALEAIEKAGSIRGAARLLGLNHRRLLERIHRAERLLGVKLVEVDTRGSRLTREARRLVEEYRRLEEELPRCVEVGGVECKG